MTKQAPKVLVTKIGLDGHDRGSRVVASFLRDAGMEVVYTPPWQDIPTVVKLAMEEDVDVIGVSSLATDHLIVPKLMQALRAAGLDDIAVVVGGIVPDADEAALLQAGVARVFHPGSALEDIAAEIGGLRNSGAKSASDRLGGTRMNKPLDAAKLAERETGAAQWQREYAEGAASDKTLYNRSGVEVKPLYTPQDWSGDYAEALGYPGQPPYTRGIYASMHRGRSWSQRQLIGLGTPPDYNARLLEMIAQGTSAVSLIPCNSVFRGYDMDEVHAELLGTCGVVANTAEHMDQCLAGVDLARTSCAMNDPSPFTLLAFMLAAAKKRGVDWRAISGTSNQSDYLSHYVANHMFFRIALPGARRILTDHIEFCGQQLPRWNPLSVVGQHMQQAGATPAEAMAFTLSSAIQYADDCIARGMDPDAFLPRFTFFFDISVSLFEEIAKFRAGRRIWARITRERLGARDPRSWRFKFHGQTSGADLTRAQPLNNIARVTVQAIAGILGGLQSLHTDAYDEALSCPTEFGARIAVNTQNILREEARLTDVIDPLGGSYYIESLTDEMERKILAVMAEVEAAGGMYAAVEQGLVQKKIGASARAFQEKVESGEQTVVGVNAYKVEEGRGERQALPTPDPAKMQAHIAAFSAYKDARSQTAVKATLDRLAAAANDPKQNIFARVVEAAEAGCTHGEICATLRRELGFGQPLVMV